ncbi:hypothetical protein HNP49_003194 [Pseudomonas fluvialis]|uniref:Lipoprotein n=1 Tax=Pseudomonas fluvialis TaxID=1793966 RepID=A0A7X0BVN6_9PSED|nr:hypothetical protein [Pseudomonas fluvialis]MBB6343006.1 hypothetical protein [Pseudomonas fluvialis]
MRPAIKPITLVLGLLLSAHIQAAPFASIDCSHVEEPISQEKLKYKSNKDELQSLSHTATIYSYGKNGQETTSIEQSPQVAVKVWNGWLTGSDRGEWGGELVFVDASGNPEILLNDNIHDIYKTDNGAIVIAGLSHMLSNDGRIYLVTRNGASVDYRILFGLDGAPKESWMTSSGEIYINTSYGVSILKTDSTLERALCKGHEYYKYEGKR